MKYLIVALLLTICSSRVSAQYDLELGWSLDDVPSNAAGYELLYLLPDGTQQRLRLYERSRTSFAMIVDQEGEYRFAWVALAEMNGEYFYCTTESVVVQSITGGQLQPAIPFTVRQLTNGLTPAAPCNAPDCNVVQ